MDSGWYMLGELINGFVWSCFRKSTKKHLKQMLNRHDDKYGGLQELKANCLWCPHMEFRIL